MTISALRGIYHDGIIEPLEPITDKEEKKVIILFLNDSNNDSCWDDEVSKDFLRGYSDKDKAYDKL